jgi:hypothetical protein
MCEKGLKAVLDLACPPDARQIIIAHTPVDQLEGLRLRLGWNVSSIILASQRPDRRASMATVTGRVNRRGPALPKKRQSMSHRKYAHQKNNQAAADCAELGRSFPLDLPRPPDGRLA